MYAIDPSMHKGTEHMEIIMKVKMTTQPGKLFENVMDRDNVLSYMFKNEPEMKSSSIKA